MKTIVAIVAFDGMSAFHLSAPCLIFGADRPGMPAFEARVCSVDVGPLHISAGMKLETPYGLEGLRGASIIIVPSWIDLDNPPPAELTEALRREHANGALIVGLCLGSFVVAAAGLLDGKRATTHWASAEKLQAKHPSITVDLNALYVDAGTVVTSAGVVAALDCCLHIVRKRFGAATAMRLARHIVAAPHRQGGQAQFVEQPMRLESTPDRFAAAVDEVRGHPGAAHTIDSAAASAGMTRRTFTRRFRRQFQAGFSDWLAGLRVERAQRLLETTDFSIDAIAYEAGFGTPTSLRQHFAARLETTPAQYRREFGERFSKPTQHTVK